MEKTIRYNRTGSVLTTAGFFVLTVLLLSFPGFYRPKPTFPAVSRELPQILFLGDSNIDYSFDGTEIPVMLTKKADVVVYNEAIGGTCAAKSSNAYNPVNYYGMFSFYNLSRMIEAGDYSVMTRNQDFLHDARSDIMGKELILSHLDYSAMDYVIIHYGMNEYFAGFPAEGENPRDEMTYAGAMREGIERIHRMCPDAKIILSSITYCRVGDEYDSGTETVSGYSCDLGGGTIDVYRDTLEKISKEYEYTWFLDNLEGLDINDSNYLTEGFLQDKMHLGETGRERYTQNLYDLLCRIGLNE